MVEIRIASLSEVVVLRERVSESVPGDFKGQLNTEQIDSVYEQMYSQSVRHNAAPHEQCYLIARLDGTDCGVASFIRQGPDLFLLTKINVLSPYRLKGAGRALFTQALRCIKERHPATCTVELTINSHNRDYTFYTHLGMHKIREELIDLEEFTLTQDVLAIEI